MMRDDAIVATRYDLLLSARPEDAEFRETILAAKKLVLESPRNNPIDGSIIFMGVTVSLVLSTKKW